MIKKKAAVKVYRVYKGDELIMTASRRKIMTALDMPEGISFKYYRHRRYRKVYRFEPTGEVEMMEMAEIAVQKKKKEKEKKIAGRTHEETLDYLYRHLLPAPHTTVLNIKEDPEDYLKELKEKGINVTYEKRPDMCGGKRIGYFWVLKGELWS